MMLERYGHGGDLETASKLFGRTADAFVDFSSNMNPWGPPGCAKAAMLAAWEHIHAYPDPSARRLRAALSERHGVPPEAIWIGNGAAEAIDLSLRAIRPAVAALAAPGFAEYETAVAHAGGEVLTIPLAPEREFSLSEEAVLQASAQADTIVLGHPNNPTGRALEGDAVQAVLSAFRAAVIDEAFLDFSPEEERLTLIRTAAERPGLFVTRSLTKFYAIPGLRLGYVAAHPDEIARIRALAVPWSANGIALAVGEAVLGDREFAERTISWLAPEREWFRTQLQALGLRVFPSDTNFLLVQFPPERAWRALAAQSSLGREGVLIRNASTFRSLDDTYIRLAVKRREANEQLLQTLHAYMAGERVKL
jgi:threonine-phosphate decarboxylase